MPLLTNPASPRLRGERSVLPQSSRRRSAGTSHFIMLQKPSSASRTPAPRQLARSLTRQVSPLGSSSTRLQDVYKCADGIRTSPFQQKLSSPSAPTTPTQYRHLPQSNDMSPRLPRAVAPRPPTPLNATLFFEYATGQTNVRTSAASINDFTIMWMEREAHRRHPSRRDAHRRQGGRVAARTGLGRGWEQSKKGPGDKRGSRSRTSMETSEKHRWDGMTCCNVVLCKLAETVA